MACVANSTHGELRWNGVKVAKVQNVTFDTSRANLETTGIGDMDSTYCYGQRNTSGSATVLYKSDDPATVSLMGRIFSDTAGEPTDVMEMTIFTGGKKVSGVALISSQGVAVSVGQNTAVNVSFVISGGATGVF